MLLLKGWPKAKVIADLDTFQSGEDREGGNSPLFVAADQLQKDAQKREGATLAARFAAAIKAFILHEQGIKAVRVSEIRNAMKSKSEVDASFPGTATTRTAGQSPLREGYIQDGPGRECPGFLKGFKDMSDADELRTRLTSTPLRSSATGSKGSRRSTSYSITPRAHANDGFIGKVYGGAPQVSREPSLTNGWIRPVIA